MNGRANRKQICRRNARRRRGKWSRIGSVGGGNARWSLRAGGMFARTKLPQRYRREITHAIQDRTKWEPTGAIPIIHKGRVPRTSSNDSDRAHSLPGLYFAINGRASA